MLEEVDALPRAEREAPGAHGNSEGGLGERCLDVRRHVVGPLGAVDEERIALGHESLEEGEEVALHVGVGVLLDEERGGGVAAEDGGEPRGDARLGDDGGDVAGDLVQALAVSADVEGVLVLAHAGPTQGVSRGSRPKSASRTASSGTSAGVRHCRYVRSVISEYPDGARARCTRVTSVVALMTQTSGTP